MLTVEQVNKQFKRGMSGSLAPFESAIISMGELANYGYFCHSGTGGHRLVVLYSPVLKVQVVVANPNILQVGILRNIWEYSRLGGNSYADYLDFLNGYDYSDDAHSEENTEKTMRKWLEQRTRGYRIIETVQDLVDCVNANWEALTALRIVMTRKSKARPVLQEGSKVNPMNPRKWLPEHFTPGTIVSCDDGVSKYSAVHGQHEVISVTGNGPNSYCVVTTTMVDSMVTPGTTDNKVFNIDHVVNIVKPGRGNAVFKERLKYLDVVSASHFRMNVELRKKYVRLGDLVDATLAQYSNSICRGAVLDWDSLRADLLKQSFVVMRPHYNRGNSEYPLYIAIRFDLRYPLADKKRAKKWIKANINRYLTSAKKIAEESERIDDDMYADDY